jgi:hypothetical protein
MAPSYLPPDPHAPQPPAPTPPAARTGSARGLRPPAAADAPARDRGGLALGLSAGAIGLLAVSVGGLFPLTIAGSAAGWALGARARARGSAQGAIAVTMGIAGVVLGVVAGALWIAFAGDGGDPTIR